MSLHASDARFSATRLEGHPVPAFHGPSSTGATLRSDAFIGKVPMAICVIGDTAGAVSVLRQLSDALSSFGDRRVQLLVIARDTAAGVRHLAESEGLNVPVVADADGSISTDLGTHRHTSPFVVLVDSSGRVRRVATLPRDRTIAQDILDMVDGEVAADPQAYDVLPIDIG